MIESSLVHSILEIHPSLPIYFSCSTKMLHPSRVAQIVGSWEWRSGEVETERGIGGEKISKKDQLTTRLQKQLLYTGW